jgi:signal transduction histidine kinase
MDINHPLLFLILLGVENYSMAKNEAEAVQILRSFQPDIVVLDIDSKQCGSCLDIAKAIKASSDIPIILVASNLDIKTYNELKTLNPQSFLYKPLNPMKLAQSVELTVRGYLEFRQLRREAEQFYFLASHDLKEPIRNITSFASLLEMELGDNLSEKAKAYLQYIKQGGQRIHSLTVGILENSNLINKRLYCLDTVDLNCTLQIAGQLAQTSFGDRRLHIAAERLPFVKTDPTLIEFVFKKLLHNALKFNESPEALVKVQSETSDG